MVKILPTPPSLEVAPTNDITVFSANREGESLGTIAFVTRDHMNAATTMAMMYSDFTWVPPGRSVERYVVTGNLLTLQRNECVQRMQGDWLLFIDDDMVWEPDAIRKLVETREELDADILGGLCFRRSAPHFPTMFMRETPTAGGYNFLETWTDDVIEVDATGMAFVIIHKRVFERIAGGPMPAYEERVREGGGPPNFFRWEGSLGEDLRFCQDAKAAGCRIFVDTRIEVGHVAEIEIRKRHFLLELVGRDERTYEARKALNDKMGLPTLSLDAALDALDLNPRIGENYGE